MCVCVTIKRTWFINILLKSKSIHLLRVLINKTWII